MPARSPHNRDPQFVSTVLAQVRDGSSSAFDALVPLVYEELHELARAQRRRWRGDDTLDTTALVPAEHLPDSVLLEQSTPVEPAEDASSDRLLDGLDVRPGEGRRFVESDAP